MDGIECLNCGHVNPDDAIYCEECGVELSKPDPEPETDPAFFPVVADDDPETDVLNADAAAPEQPMTAESGESEVAQGGVEQEQGEPDDDATPYSPTLPWQSEPESPSDDVEAELIEAETTSPGPVETEVTEVLGQSPAPEQLGQEAFSSAANVAADPIGEDPMSDNPSDNPMDNAVQPTGANTNLELEAEPAAPIAAEFPTDPGSLEPEPEGSLETEESEDPDLLYSPGTVLDMPDEPEPEPIPPTPLPPMAMLIAEGGERFELPDLPVLYVGKPNDQIPVQVDLSGVAESEIISRVHAVIHRFKHEDQPETFFLEDAGSLNGTILNGEPLQAGTRHRKPLNPGDAVTFGRKRQITFRFEVETQEAEG